MQPLTILPPQSAVLSLPEPHELHPADLYRACDPASVPFATTDDAQELTDIIGQPRALAAVELGLAMRSPGYNLFALGPPGVGKHFLVERYLERQAAREPVPDDWCYVFDFSTEHRPKALRLPAGQGAALRHDMEELLEQLRPALTAAFEREDYQTRRRMIEQELEDLREKTLQDLGVHAHDHGLAVVRTPLGLIFAPLRDNQVLSPEEAERLPEEEKQRLAHDMEHLKEELEKVLAHMPRLHRERLAKIRELDREVTRFAVGSLIDELRKKYAGLDDVVAHLDAVERDVVRRARELLASRDDGSDDGNTPAREHPALRRYLVNVLIDHGSDQHAPVVREDNPTFSNLIGRVEHLSQMGALVTDFTLIKPGALHRANGGTLILDARQLLLQPFAWEGLKRVLQSGKLRIESLAQAWSLISTISLEPEPIPLTVKIVLLGDRLLYYLLSAYDPDFPELFKVAVDFEDSLDRDDGQQELYARMIAQLVRQEELKPFDRTAVARVLEHGSRILGDRGKLSLHTGQLLDLLRESSHWSGAEALVTAEHVQKALDAQVFRADRVRQRLREEMRRGVLLVNTEGTVVGQVNGLSVLQLGGYAFGHPGRITARVRLGGGEVVDIEREVELGGPLHSKGVLILSGFLGERYSADQPLSLKASLVFEQSYGGVEGDSASLAELCALLSAIAGVPIRQSLALTGSVDQRGQAQPIGGVNEKIEGFFDACGDRGLSGQQGVLIPRSNVQHLMLRRDVVDAVRAGKFHVYGVETVDEALELLTGIPAGERAADGSYPEGTINRRVADRLAFLSSRRMAFLKGDGKEGGS